MTAIDSGFHSLVELLASNEPRQTEKDRALGKAVEIKRLDFVELLVAKGAKIDSVQLALVLLTWDRSLMQFFLDHGSDPTKGNPFLIAFHNKVQRALRPFVEYKKAHPEFPESLQAQADRALRHFAGQADMKWISLLLWAGANPPRTGAVEVEPAGTQGFGRCRLVFEQAHTTPSLVLSLVVSLTEGIGDESWALDNVLIETEP